MNRLISYFEDLTDFYEYSENENKSTITINVFSGRFELVGDDGKITVKFDPELYKAETMEKTEIDVEVIVTEPSEAMRFYCQDKFQFESKLILDEMYGEVNWLIQFLLTRKQLEGKVFVHSPCKTEEFGWISRANEKAKKVINLFNNLSVIGFYNEIPEVIYRAEGYSDAGKFFVKYKDKPAKVIGADELNVTDTINWIFAETIPAELSAIIPEVDENRFGLEALTSDVVVLKSSVDIRDVGYFFTGTKESHQLYIERYFKDNKVSVTVTEIVKDENDEERKLRTLLYEGFNNLLNAVYFIRKWIGDRNLVSDKCDAQDMLTNLFEKNQTFFDELRKTYKGISFLTPSVNRKISSKTEEVKASVVKNVVTCLDILVYNNLFQLKLGDDYVQFYGDEELTLKNIARTMTKIGTTKDELSVGDDTSIFEHKHIGKRVKGFRLATLDYRIRSTKTDWVIELKLYGIRKNELNNQLIFSTEYYIDHDKFETLDVFYSAIVEPWLETIEKEDYAEMTDAEMFEFANSALMSCSKEYIDKNLEPLGVEPLPF